MWLKRAQVIILVATAASCLAWMLSPWPSALFYRLLFDRGGVAMNEALARHVPSDVVAQTDIAYAADDPDARLDVFRPAAAEGKRLPVVVWIHDRRAADFSTVSNIARTSPPLFISAGNADPLLPQSQNLADVARANSVIVDSLFFPADHSPALAHEYQFDLGNNAGKLAFERMIAFLVRFST